MRCFFMIKIIMNGCNGKMGKVICNLIDNDPTCEVVAGIDPNQVNSKFPVFSNIFDCNIDADVLIDFSTALAVPDVLTYCENKKLPVVVCTTGLDDFSLNKIEVLSKSIPVFKSANMSLGINLIASLLKKASVILNENGFDIEIIEKHHNQKIDSPSGTALLLADSINSSFDNKFNYIYDRSSFRKPRNKNEIGFSVVRGGNIVGEHSVIFAGNDEVIEFSHFAYSKEVFALGAINAAKFLYNKPAGKYDMQSFMQSLNL